jgi:hypothetical protein
MATALSLQERLRRKLPRVWKFARRWAATLTASERVTARPVFVLGAQRSGTRLPLHVLDQCPDIITYSEGSDPFFNGVLLRDMSTIVRSLRRLPFPIVVLKPICESHRGAELLDAFPGSRAVWIYRDFKDTVNSAVAKWQTGRRNLQRLATGDGSAASWRAGGLSEQKLQLARRLYDADMSLHAAEAVMWYLRTSLFFDVGLDRRADVLLVKYDDLVTEPAAGFARLFAFLGSPFHSEYLSGVYDSSMRSKPFPPIPLEITGLCEMLTERLDAHARQTRELQPSQIPATLDAKRA